MVNTASAKGLDGPQRHGVTERVEKWQDAKDGILRGQTYGTINRVDVVADVGIAQHDAFGHAR